MAHILSLEFDAHHFKDRKSCIDWLQQSDFDYMARLHGFRLRLRKKCIFLTGESRKVWSWYNNLWKYPYTILERPDVHVVVVKKTGTQVFGPVDIPEQLPTTVEQLERRAEKKAISEEKARVRREKQKLKRKAERQQQKSRSKGKKAKVTKSRKLKSEPIEAASDLDLPDGLPDDLMPSPLTRQNGYTTLE